MTKFYYQGYGSYRITATDGIVIYIDPASGEGYDLPADLILVRSNSYSMPFALFRRKPLFFQRCLIIFPFTDNPFSFTSHGSDDMSGIIPVG